MLGEDQCYVECLKSAQDGQARSYLKYHYSYIFLKVKYFRDMGKPRLD